MHTHDNIELKSISMCRFQLIIEKVLSQCQLFQCFCLTLLPKYYVEHVINLITIFYRYSHVDLAYTFLNWSPVGVFSSICFLEYKEEYRPCIEDRHWRYQLFGLQRSESQKLFYILGLPYTPPVQRTFRMDVSRKYTPDGRPKRR